MQPGGIPVSVEAVLARVETKIDAMNDRHDRFVKELDTTTGRLNEHHTRIDKLESHKDRQDGERKGIEAVIKVLWALVTLFGASIIGGAIYVTRIMHL